MTHTEINRKLALALGWEIMLIGTAIYVMTCQRGANREWKLFNFRDWDVCGPIAQRYDCFPEKTNCGDWAGYVPESWADVVYANTPQKAIALAVIATHGAGVLK